MSPLIFISCAPEDRQGWEEFRTHFAPSAQAAELWHNDHIMPGDQKSLTRAEALMNASLVLPILSPDWLAHGEWIEEVRKVHERGVRVVPIYWRTSDWRTSLLGQLDLLGLPRDGRPLRPMPDHDDAWVTIVNDLRPLLSPRHAFDAALHLDRTTQWRDLIEGCKTAEHALFYVWGERSQHISLFIERVRKHLTEWLPPARRHRHLELPFRVGELHAYTAGEWELRLKDGLQLLGHGPSGPLAQLLAQAAADQPLFILLGNEPFREADLDQAERGLCAFIKDLPGHIGKAAPKHPIRVLLSAEYAGQDRGFGCCPSKDNLRPGVVLGRDRPCELSLVWLPDLGACSRRIHWTLRTSSYTGCAPPQTGAAAGAHGTAPAPQGRALAAPVSTVRGVLAVKTPPAGRQALSDRGATHLRTHCPDV